MPLEKSFKIHNIICNEHFKKTKLKIKFSPPSIQRLLNQVIWTPCWSVPVLRVKTASMCHTAPAACLWNHAHTGQTGAWPGAAPASPYCNEPLDRSPGRCRLVARRSGTEPPVTTAGARRSALKHNLKQTLNVENPRLIDPHTPDRTLFTWAAGGSEQSMIMSVLIKHSPPFFFSGASSIWLPESLSPLFFLSACERKEFIHSFLIVSPVASIKQTETSYTETKNMRRYLPQVTAKSEQKRKTVKN